MTAALAVSMLQAHRTRCMPCRMGSPRMSSLAYITRVTDAVARERESGSASSLHPLQLEELSPSRSRAWLIQLSEADALKEECLTAREALPGEIAPKTPKAGAAFAAAAGGRNNQ